SQDPAGYQRTLTHRQQRLRYPHQGSGTKFESKFPFFFVFRWRFGRSLLCHYRPLLEAQKRNWLQNIYRVKSS
ncbi:hypothetical protein GOODEAATRI_033972, partial [Goodea atripinnis]